MEKSRQAAGAAVTARRAGSQKGEEDRRIAENITPPQAQNGHPVLTAALAYAAKGLHIFPVPPNKKKSYKSAKYSDGRKWGATADAAQIQRDWRRWPNANVGIPTGAINGFFVVELDTEEGHGVDGFASLAALEQQHGALPATLQARSPSGSLHYYFRHPGNGIKIKNSASEIGAGVDCRGDNGMVLAPPSVRADGAYTWVNPQAAIADAPRWLLDRVVVEDHPPTPAASTPPYVYVPGDDVAFEEEVRSRSGMGVDDVWPGNDNYPPLTLQEIQAALAAIPADGYYCWLQIGAALSNELGESGFALFDRWSAKSSKYNAPACREKWRECRKLTGYTVGTIIHYANEHDPDWRAQIIDDAPPLAPDKPQAEPKPEPNPKPGPAKPTLADLTHNMRDLRTMTFDPLQFIVPNYIPEGLTALGGRPKIGKSWLALDAAIAVAMGSTCLGQTCEQGDVLGLFLEDSKRRLQRRMTKMLGATITEWPERFTYATAWPRMSAGGLLLIREWIKSVKHPRLIIIDILQKFRDLTTTRRQQAATQYEGEYSALSKLQDITSGIAGLGILVLHHQRKQPADDPIDTLSGTLGLGGAIDTFAILEKDTLGFRLYGRGRDLEEFNINVEQNEKCQWQDRGPRTVDAPASAERAKIIAALTRAKEPMAANEIAKAVDREGENIRMLLSRMCLAGEIERVPPGRYRVPKVQEEIF